MVWLQGLFFNQWGIILFYTTLIVKCSYLKNHNVHYWLAPQVLAIELWKCDLLRVGIGVHTWYSNLDVGEGCSYIWLETLSFTALWLPDLWHSFSPTSPQPHGHLIFTWASSSVLVYLSGNFKAFSHYSCLPIPVLSHFSKKSYYIYLFYIANRLWHVWPILIVTCSSFSQCFPRIYLLLVAASLIFKRQNTCRSQHWYYVLPLWVHD